MTCILKVRQSLYLSISVCNMVSQTSKIQTHPNDIKYLTQLSMYGIIIWILDLKGVKKMSKTVVRKNESLDDALRRFKRAVTKAGTLQETRKREFYEKPSVKRKRKSEAARKRKKF